MIRLGPFELDRPVGRGGMGVVWLGRHVDQDVPVAVKVITSRQANTEEYHRAFHQEVRAVSALDHPGVVWIFDYGTIPEDTANASGGELVEGSPYLVMEYASRGTLRSLNRTLAWPELKAVLMSVLDALAHAHARGVLHRDLKPDNVLIASSEDLRPGFKITDFGIAFPVDDSVEIEDKPVGTPQYMAPEQIRNEVDVYGPHTDLYALGCLAWRLVTGKLPFHGLKGASLMYAQLQKEPPALEPAIRVPEGFERFLRVLLAKDPADRFRRASDAAVALARLGDPVSDTAVFRLEQLGGVDEELDLDTATLKIVVGGSARAPAVAIGPEVRPGLPQTWRLPPTASRPLRLLGAGLGLFGLRPVPFVGREAERDVLWRALAHVHHDGRAQAVIVRGEAGVGKSRLVQWVADRAHEVGAASILETPFAAPDAALENLRRALVKFLRSHPLSQELRDTGFGELLAGLRLDRILVADAIELLLDPERMELPDQQRLVLIRRVWEVLSRDRPLLVWFDDAQWGPEAIKLVRNLLEAQESRASRILVVLSVLDGAVDAHSEIARGLDALAHRRDVQVVEVGPFEGEDRQELVRSLLGLDRGLSERVAERTEGNPLFAVQLVGDWVERGVLHPGPTGFQLAQDSPLPASLREVWEGRILALVAGLDPPALELLERAATLGREVDVFEWQAASDDEDGAHAAQGRMYFNPRHARLRQALMDRLLATRLGQSTDRGFVFAHALFRDAVLDRAARAGRLRDHANACASVLLPKVTDADAERVGRLLVTAGRRADALPLLLRAETFRSRTAGPPAALEVLALLQEALKTGRIPKADRAWAELYARRAEALDAVDRRSEAARDARAANKLAAAGKWRDVGARASAVLGTVALAAGRSDEAEEHFLAAVERLGPRGEVAATVRAWHRLRRIALARGDREVARARGGEVRAALARATEPRSRAIGLAALAEHLWTDGALAEARAAAGEAAALDAEHGELAAEAKARSLLAGIAEEEGQLGSARDHWTRVVRLLEELGSSRRHAVLARCRLALVECRAGRFTGARASVEPVLAEGEPADPRLKAAVHATLALAAAGRARWERVDAHLASCESCWSELTTREPEYAEVMTMAGDLAARRGQRQLADRAWHLARARYLALGNPDQAGAVQRRLDRQAPAR